MMTPGALIALSGKLRCAPDDILDACCLAVAGTYVARGEAVTLPEAPERDETGLLMRMVLPAVHMPVFDAGPLLRP